MNHSKNYLNIVIPLFLKDLTVIKYASSILILLFFSFNIFKLGNAIFFLITSLLETLFYKKLVIFDELTILLLSILFIVCFLLPEEIKGVISLIKLYDKSKVSKLGKFTSLNT